MEREPDCGPVLNLIVDILAFVIVAGAVLIDFLFKVIIGAFLWSIFDD